MKVRQYNPKFIVQPEPFNEAFTLLKESVEKVSGKPVCVPYTFVRGAPFNYDEIVYNIHYFAEVISSKLKV